MTSKGSRALSTRADEETHRRVEQAAARLGLEKAAWIREAILLVLDNEEEAFTKPPQRRQPQTFMAPHGRIPPRR